MVLLLTQIVFYSPTCSPFKPQNQYRTRFKELLCQQQNITVSTYPVEPQLPLSFLSICVLDCPFVPGTATVFSHPRCPSSAGGAHPPPSWLVLLCPVGDGARHVGLIVEEHLGARQPATSLVSTRRADPTHAAPAASVPEWGARGGELTWASSDPQPGPSPAGRPGVSKATAPPHVQWIRNTHFETVSHGELLVTVGKTDWYT